MENKKYISELYLLYESKMQSALQTQEIKDTRHQIIEITDELNKGLSQKQQIKLQELLELEHHREALEGEEIFIFGFSLAIKILINGLVNDDEKVVELCKRV